MVLANKDEEFFSRLETYFLKHGYRNITVGDLAAQLQCSRRRLYSYADSKEALFFLVAERFFDNIQVAGRARARVEKNFEVKITAYLQAGVRGASRLSDAFQSDIALTERGRQLYDDHQKKRMDGLRSIIQQGIDCGVFREIHSVVIAEMMLTIVRRIRQPEFQKKAGVTYSEALTEISTVLRFGILNGPEQPGTNNRQINAKRARNGKSGTKPSAP